jgi:hypothetical protein
MLSGKGVRTMGIIETVKDVAVLVQKADNIDLLKRILELQQQVYEVVNENHGLKERLATRDQLTFRKNSYWRGDEGPFCSRCWDAEALLVRLHTTQGNYPHCAKCDTWVRDPDEAPVQHSFGGTVSRGPNDWMAR